MRFLIVPGREFLGEPALDEPLDVLGLQAVRVHVIEAIS